MFALKKTCFIFILVTVISLFSMVSAAWGDITYSSDVSTTEEKFFIVTRPLVMDSTTNKTFYIIGNILYDETTVESYIYSELDGCYVPFPNIYGESKCQISNAGFFNNEIILPNKGNNKLLLVVYRTSEPENKQFGKFSVRLRSESLVDKIVNGLDKALDFFESIVPR